MSDSLRQRVVRTVALALPLALVGMALAVLVVARHLVFEGVDAELEARAETLAALVEREGKRLEFELGPEPPASSRAPDAGALWLLDEAGRTVAVTQDAGPPPPDLVPGQVVSISFQGERARALAVALEPPFDEEFPAPTDFDNRATLIVVQQLGRAQALLLRLALVIAVIAATVVAVATFATRRAVVRGLAPVEHLEAEVTKLGDALDARLSRDALPSELVPLVDRLNETLDDLERAFSRERRLTDDVAHELRTPIAGLRAELELALLRPRDGEAYRRAIDSALVRCTELSELIDSLLLLARADAPSTKARLAQRASPFDLAVLARGTWESFAAMAEQRLLELDDQLCAIELETDEGLLNHVVRNVVENAILYAPESSTVRLATVRGGLEVSNDAPELEQEHLEHLFDRFWRLEESRTTPGTGIGLAVAKALSNTLEFELSAALDGGRLTIRLEPRGPSAPPDPEGAEQGQ